MQNQIFSTLVMGNFKKVGAGALVLSFFMASCNKQEQPTASSGTAANESMITMSSGATGKTPAQINQEIINFYGTMKTLEHGGTAIELMTPEEVNFLIEGTYNKYVAERQFDCSVAKYESSIKVPMDGSGGIKKQDVAKAFWTIKAELLAKMNTLGAQVKMESFDMKLEAKPSDFSGSFASFSFVTIFKVPSPGFPIDMTEWCNDNFHEGDTHVWKTEGRTNDQTLFVYGQAAINHSTKGLVPGTLNTTLPGAATALRAKGIGNYQKFYCQSYLCGYFVNVEEKIYDPNQNPQWVTTPNQYVSMNIPDYNNLKYWNTKMIDNPALDPFYIYKRWLTTPMMNFYLGFIPEIIGENLTPNKTFANFHIWTEYGYSQANVPYAVLFHYNIYSGNFVPTIDGDCTGKLELGYL